MPEICCLTLQILWGRTLPRNAYVIAQMKRSLKCSNVQNINGAKIREQTERHERKQYQRGTEIRASQRRT